MEQLISGLQSSAIKVALNTHVPGRSTSITHSAHNLISSEVSFAASPDNSVKSSTQIRRLAKEICNRPAACRLKTTTAQLVQLVPSVRFQKKRLGSITLVMNSA